MRRTATLTTPRCAKYGRVCLKNRHITRRWKRKWVTSEEERRCGSDERGGRERSHSRSLATQRKKLYKCEKKRMKGVNGKDRGSSISILEETVTEISFVENIIDKCICELSSFLLQWISSSPSSSKPSNSDEPQYDDDPAPESPSDSNSSTSWSFCGMIKTLAIKFESVI
ncbi:hypothetical protein L484_002757 [Morus notabilis]|uniref:Uncharacterized protein n=1 Tax=Morus notabilis TaxID=981085 RepID=W9QBH8_9ROSA|nr:hypothetical protein L484_002757 [Morus notabilis]